MVFAIFITFVILLKIGELLLARTNERWLLRYVAVESEKILPLYSNTAYPLFLYSLLQNILFTGTGNYNFPFVIL